MKKLFLLLPMFILFACQQDNGKDNKQQDMAPTAKKEMADPALMSLFEEVNVVKMHLFASKEAMPNAEDYPYVGKPITGDAMKMLSEELQPNESGGTYACYHTENSDHFILRVPGNETGKMVLAKWDGAMGKLVKITDLAYRMCGESACQQQDAWLADLDDSRTLELIVRKQTSDGDGNISEESFEVLTDDGTGHFKKTDEKLASLAVKEYYVMQK